MDQRVGEQRGRVFGAFRARLAAPPPGPPFALRSGAAARGWWQREGVSPSPLPRVGPCLDPAAKRRDGAPLAALARQPSRISAHRPVAFLSRGRARRVEAGGFGSGLGIAAARRSPEPPGASRGSRDGRRLQAWRPPDPSSCGGLAAPARSLSPRNPGCRYLSPPGGRSNDSVASRVPPACGRGKRVGSTQTARRVQPGEGRPSQAGGFFPPFAGGTASRSSPVPVGRTPSAAARRDRLRIGLKRPGMEGGFGPARSITSPHREAPLSGAEGKDCCRAHSPSLSSPSSSQVGFGGRWMTVVVEHGTPLAPGVTDDWAGLSSVWPYCVASLGGVRSRPLAPGVGGDVGSPPDPS
ncbi:UNVERIFIED_CONTAM: hypothetical protein FKN15_050377 [Acipenser sinensis]